MELDEEFDKIFHPKTFAEANQNLQCSSLLDVERKKYYEKAHDTKDEHVLGDNEYFPWRSSRNDEVCLYRDNISNSLKQKENSPQPNKVTFDKTVEDVSSERVKQQIFEDRLEYKCKQYIKASKRHKSTKRRINRHTSLKCDVYESNEYGTDPVTQGTINDAVGIAEHRFEKSSRHSLISNNKSVSTRNICDSKNRCDLINCGYGFRREVDHSPHKLFVEMDVLEGDAWIERSRWIKYEEDLEAEVGRWGKPHVSSLTFHSMINLRLCIETGSLLLDVTAQGLPDLLHRVVEDLLENGIIEESQKGNILRILLYRHKHVHPHRNTFKISSVKNSSSTSLNKNTSDDVNIDMDTIAGSSDGVPEMTHGAVEGDSDKLNKWKKAVSSDGFKKLVDEDLGDEDKAKNNWRRTVRSESFKKMVGARKQNILFCLDEGTEGAIVLVGSLDDISKPIVALARLAEAIEMPNTIEISLPVRFIFILLTPSQNLNMDPHEIGRAFATVLSNPMFYSIAYRVERKQELLRAINEFLDDSVVLPPGDWDEKHILPINEIKEMRQRRISRKSLKRGSVSVSDTTAVVEKVGDSLPKRNPLLRTNIPFGGLIDDIKHRYPLYIEDIKDGLNSQCFAAIIFIYFAALSGAIAFGGIMGSKTNDDIGVSETLVMTCVCGIIFALFSGCPLIIIGTTGPVLLYDEALYQFCDSSLPNQFLYWRVWIGFWTFIISLVFAGFQGSTFVRFLTKFTKDIFAGLVSLLFIYDAMRKLFLIFEAHPLVGPENYCAYLNNSSSCKSSFEKEISEENGTQAETNGQLVDCDHSQVSVRPQPNTALLSMILMFGTFFIAYFLRIFRNSKFLGRNARRALGDFGVPIAIVIMVLVDYGAGDTYTEKLHVPEGLQVTKSEMRGWFISPLGKSYEENLAIWAMFVALLPAMLLYVLLFMETQICQLIMMEKTNEVKGAGVHLDIVLLSLMNMVCALFGGPWICAATVRSVSHVSALVVHSPSKVPGESPKVIGVRDQRVTATIVSILIGISVLLSPLLKLVPFAVLFGIFLYMGVSGMNGVQFFDRLTLMLMPVKHHPNVSYVRKVKTWRLHMFTIFQGLGLIVLWIVKSTPAALAFPFFVVAMIPYRLLLKFIFNECEMDALDGPEAGKKYDDGNEDDFYETANTVPVTSVFQVAKPKARSLFQRMNMPIFVADKEDSINLTNRNLYST